MKRINLKRLYPWQSYKNGIISTREPTDAEIKKFPEDHKDYCKYGLLFERPGLYLNEHGRTPVPKNYGNYEPSYCVEMFEKYGITAATFAARGLSEKKFRDVKKNGLPADDLFLLILGY